MDSARFHGRAIGGSVMSDLLWLGLLAGLFVLTLAYTKLCDEA